MDSSTVRSLGFILAEQARIEGMKAENAARAVRNQSPAYTEQDFFDRAQAIDAIARNI